MEAIVILHGDFRKNPSSIPFHIHNLFMQRRLVLVQIFHILADTAIVFIFTSLGSLPRSSSQHQTNALFRKPADEYMRIQTLAPTPCRPGNLYTPPPIILHTGMQYSKNRFFTPDILYVFSTIPVTPSTNISTRMMRYFSIVISISEANLGKSSHRSSYQRFPRQGDEDLSHW